MADHHEGGGHNGGHAGEHKDAPGPPGPHGHDLKEQDEAERRLREAMNKNAAFTLDLLRTWDADGNGEVSKDEFRMAVMALKLGMDGGLIDALFERADVNGDGHLDFQELEKLMTGGHGHHDQDAGHEPHGNEPHGGKAAEGGKKTKPKPKASASVPPPQAPREKKKEEPADAHDRATLTLRKGTGPVGKALLNASTSSVTECLREALHKNAVRVVDIFRRWDMDGDWKVTKEEMASALLELGFEADEEAMEALFAEYDEDKSGAVDYRELQHRMRKGLEIDMRPAAVRKRAQARAASVGNKPYRIGFAGIAQPRTFNTTMQRGGACFGAQTPRFKPLPREGKLSTGHEVGPGKYDHRPMFAPPVARSPAAFGASARRDKRTGWVAAREGHSTNADVGPGKYPPLEPVPHT